MDPGRRDVQALWRDLRGVRTRLDVDVSQSRLTGGQADWTEQRLSLSQSLSSDLTLSASVEQTERFGLNDTWLAAGVVRRWARGSLDLTVSGTPDADYRPEVGVRVSGAYALGRGWEATLVGSVDRYPVGTVSSLQPGLATDIF
jgi:hypothetical protein